MKITSVEFVKSVADAQNIPQDNLSQIAFAGRSNVGKSSLINCLLNRKRIAKTSSTPGKTRLLNFFKINGILYFVDLPGYGYAKAPKNEIKQWQTLIESFFLHSKKLVKVISLIDSRIGPTALDRQLFDWVNNQSIPLVIVATKADKQSKSVLLNNIKKFSRQISTDLGHKIIPFSVRTGTGKQELWKEILN
jgi:GTP-binding protein